MAHDKQPDDLLETPLARLHREAGARMVPFAGYAMPVQYPAGILAEHSWTREHAGLFDVSHMGQARLVGPDHATVAAALEALVPADIAGLAFGQQRYTQLLNEEGGILDDLMVARPSRSAGGGELILVVNAATKEADYRHIAARLPEGVELRREDDRALLALQGPEAAGVLGAIAPETGELAFMTGASMTLSGIPAHVSRSGYTGEDGFEISVPADRAEELWGLLTRSPAVKPVGLGARDSLRLEAGLPLYGHDINQETSPVEAGLAWSIQRRRREEGGFPGHIRISEEIANGPLRRRVGIRVEGRAPAREHADILDLAGELIGKVTSGGFGPSVGGPVAMGYVVADYAAPGTRIGVMIREKRVPAEVVKLPFVPHRYRR
ncbi:glycine cleavage system aminomethyltransferase GcvT [Enterovirga sp. CN4-39]|uniref:glycine cleavage system aminomethyltransferase GcvT n=1 Tax=Enterovirga sp. CN4-39 TaxID=3400910 RepID=UPI003BFFA6CA